MKTRAGARENARQKSCYSEGDVIVVRRTDHPEVAGVYWYSIAESDKRRWTEGETLVARFRAGEEITEAKRRGDANARLLAAQSGTYEAGT